MRPIRVEVTQEDIEEGAPANCQRCPVARAVRRALGLTEVEIQVVLDPDLIDVGGIPHDMPYSVGRWVREYDGSVGPEGAKPISFEMYV